MKAFPTSLPPTPLRNAVCALQMGLSSSCLKSTPFAHKTGVPGHQLWARLCSGMQSSAQFALPSYLLVRETFDFGPPERLSASLDHASRAAELALGHEEKAGE